MASEEPSLPRLPAVSWDEQTQSFSNNPKKRGRVHRGQSGASVRSLNNNNSSDPFVFSSDDDAGLDNYVEGRRKKRYIGSWFQQHPTSSDSTFSEAIAEPKGKRTLARQNDSGVFLASDSAESDVLEELEIPTRPKLPQLDRARVAVAQVSVAERLLRERVQECLDTGDETIDFWNMNLEELSNETIEPLCEFTCIPEVTKDVAFEQKDPELKLFLAQNRLNRLPGALFDITHLTTLSLRANQLTEIPPAIRKLCNLRELNLAQNCLTMLPVEILDLLNADSKLSTLILHPNPFVKPNQGDEMFEILEEHDPEVHEDYDLDMEPEPIQFDYTEAVPIELLPRLISRRLGRSPLQVSDSSGRIISTFKLPLEPVSQILEVEKVFKKKMTSFGPSEESLDRSQRPTDPLVPSLLESVMRTCYKSAHLAEFKDFIPEELTNLHQLFDRAMEQKGRGGLSCSRCYRSMVVPALEWVEWREMNTLTKFRKIRGKYRLDPLSEIEDELVVPFLHRACSRRCGPGGENSGWEFPKGCHGRTLAYCLYNGPPVAEG